MKGIRSIEATLTAETEQIADDVVVGLFTSKIGDRRRSRFLLIATPEGIAGRIPL